MAVTILRCPAVTPSHIAIRVSYPERGDYDWHRALAAYQAIGAVKVAFYRPEPFLAEVSVEDVVAPFAALPVTATTIHMAQARIAGFDVFVQVLHKTLAIARARVLDFEGILAGIARSGFSGPLTLEYLPQFHRELLPDGLWAAQRVSGSASQRFQVRVADSLMR